MRYKLVGVIVSCLYVCLSSGIVSAQANNEPSAQANNEPLASTTSSSSPPTPARVANLGIKTNLRFKHIANEELDSLLDIYTIAQDHMGFMWFASKSGLARFDGYDVTAYRHDDEDLGSLTTDAVNDLLVDVNGDIWIATYWGLDRYNPQTNRIQHFLHDPNVARSLSHNSVKRLYQSASGVLWVGTEGGGLNRFNPVSEDFDRFQASSEDQHSLSSNAVTQLSGDAQGLLWVGLRDLGIDLFDPEQGVVVERIRHDPKDKQSLIAKHVSAMVPASDGSMWLGTFHGLSRFQGSQLLTHAIPGCNVQYITVDSAAKVWVACSDQGIVVYEPASGRYQRYLEGKDNGNRNRVLSIFEDTNGGMWQGLASGGVYRVDRYASAFRNFSSSNYDSNYSATSQSSPASLADDEDGYPGPLGAQAQQNGYGLTSNSIDSVVEDEHGNLWVGTIAGLNYLDRQTGRIKQYRTNWRDPQSLSSPRVTALVLAPGGQVWAGTPAKGLNVLDIASGKFRVYMPDANDPASLVGNEVWSLLRDRRGQIWAGTNGGGLHRYRPATDDFLVFTVVAPNGGTPSRVMDLFEDDAGALWVSTDAGLFHLSAAAKNAQQASILRYHSSEGEQAIKPTRNVVRTVNQDRQGNLWIASEGGGVSKWDRQLAQLTTYTTLDGLAHNSVSTILQDANDMLWFATEAGLSRFDPLSGSFRTFTKKYGLPGNIYDRAVGITSANGNLIFGNGAGLTIVDPKKIYLNNAVAPLVITDLQIFNKSVAVAQGLTTDEALLSQAMTHTRQLELQYRQSVFSFSFALLNYDIPEFNQYAYQLEGFDKEWTYSGNKRTATYTNLDPGHYVFRVKGANNEGVWNEQGVALDIYIRPPWWMTWWAYCLGSLLLVLLIVGGVYSKIRNLHYKSTLQEKANLRLIKLDKLKSNFLANTSHELLTPLNGMMGIAKLLDEKYRDTDQDADNLVHYLLYSGERLSNLVSDILDFSKFADNERKLALVPTNLVGTVAAVVEVLQPLADVKKISLNNTISDQTLFVLSDRDSLFHILRNLISNGIKYSEDGEVTISVQTDGDQVAVSVADKGIGIAEGDLEAIFQAFDQLEDSNTRLHEGAGLGLAVARNLVQMHGRELTLVSNLGQGSAFTFGLQRTALTSEANSSIEGASAASLPLTTVGQSCKQVHAATTMISATLDGSAQRSADRDKSVVLIVDDDVINRLIIRKILEAGNYCVEEADSGPAALKKIANQDNINLIILDIMMPLMSGFEVCKILREKHSMHELPIIFLTAKTTDDALAEGMEAGGNDFLTKPSSKASILPRVASLLRMSQGVDADKA